MSVLVLVSIALCFTSSLAGKTARRLPDEQPLSAKKGVQIGKKTGVQLNQPLGPAQSSSTSASSSMGTAASPHAYPLVPVAQPQELGPRSSRTLARRETQQVQQVGRQRKPRRDAAPPERGFVETALDEMRNTGQVGTRLANGLEAIYEQDTTKVGRLINGALTATVGKDRTQGLRNLHDLAVQEVDGIFSPKKHSIQIEITNSLATDIYKVAEYVTGRVDNAGPFRIKAGNSGSVGTYTHIDHQPQIKNHDGPDGVILKDLTGHGDSDKPPAPNTDVPPEHARIFYNQNTDNIYVGSGIITYSMAMNAPHQPHQPPVSVGVCLTILYRLPLQTPGTVNVDNTDIYVAAHESTGVCDERTIDGSRNFNNMLHSEQERLFVNFKKQMLTRLPRSGVDPGQFQQMVNDLAEEYGENIEMNGMRTGWRGMWVRGRARGIKARVTTEINNHHRINIDLLPEDALDTE